MQPSWRRVSQICFLVKCVTTGAEKPLQLIVFKTFSAEKSTEKIRIKQKWTWCSLRLVIKKKNHGILLCALWVFSWSNIRLSEGLGIQSELVFVFHRGFPDRDFFKKLTLLENKVHFKRCRPLNSDLKSTKRGRRSKRAKGSHGLEPVPW